MTGFYRWNDEDDHDKGGDWVRGVYPEPKGKVTIPSAVNGLPVVALDCYLFVGCSDLTEVVIPETVEWLGEGVFEGSGLTSVHLPDAVRRLDWNVFFDTPLETVNVPANIEYVGAYAFYGTPWLAAQGEFAFFGVGNLIAYQGTATSVVMPDSVRVIGEEAFAECGIASVYIPASVERICNYAFDACASLADVSFGGDMKAIRMDLYSAFHGTPWLANFKAEPPDNDNFADAAALSGSSGSVTGFSVGATVEDGEPLAAFRDSTASIWWCWTAPADGAATFGTLGSGFDTVMGVYTGSSVGALTVVAENDDAFEDCTSSTVFDAVAGRTYYIGVAGYGTAAGNVSLTWTLDGGEGPITPEPDVPTPGAGTPIFTIVDGVLTAVDLNGAADVTIPDEVTSIASNVFYKCTGLKSVIIPDSVTNIGEYAFYNCRGLASVMFGSGVKLIGFQAFHSCLEIKSMTFRGNAPEIGDEMCYGPIGGCVIFSECVVYVPYGSTGWGVDIPGTWRGFQIEYIEGNEPSSPITYGLSFFANGGSGAMPSQIFTNGIAQALAANQFTCDGSTFAGWATNAMGDVIYTNGQVVSVSTDMILYAKWSEIPIITPDPEPMPEPEPEPVVTQQIWTVTFNANGGTGAMPAQTFTNGVAQVLKANAFRKFGYMFAGWAKSAGGAVVYADGQCVAITSRQTLYACWAESTAGVLGTSFAKAQTVDGALYRGDVFAGTVQVKVGKINKKGVVKVSATATMLIDGKAKKVTAKAVNVNVGDATASTDATERVPPVKVVFKAPIGEMAFEMAADGKFTLKNGSYLMAEAKIGGAIIGGGNGTFGMDGFNLSVPGILLDELLPDGEPFEVSRGKWKFAKAATVKLAKPKKGAEHSDYYDEDSGKDLIVDDTKGKTNLSGLKLTYTAKTGQFKGSFKVYALQGTGKKRKLAKYTVNVIGFVVDGVGYGQATCKKPAGTWAVTVE